MLCGNHLTHLGFASSCKALSFWTWNQCRDKLIEEKEKKKRREWTKLQPHRSSTEQTANHRDQTHVSKFQHINATCRSCVSSHAASPLPEKSLRAHSQGRKSPSCRDGEQLEPNLQQRAGFPVRMPKWGNGQKRQNIWWGEDTSRRLKSPKMLNPNVRHAHMPERRANICCGCGSSGLSSGSRH